MKKLLALLLSGLMMFSLVACSDDNVNTDDDPINNEDVSDTEDDFYDDYEDDYDDDFDEDYDDEYDDDYGFEYEDLNDVKQINMVYGDDEIKVTLYKPDGASFTMIDDPDDSGDLMSICANDYSWDGEIMGYKYYPGIGSNVPFVDYYFAGEVNAEKYESYEEDVVELDASYNGNPAMIIRYTYKEIEDDEAYTEYFVGFEYNGTNDKGLMGVRVFADEEIADETLETLFEQLFNG